MNPMKNLLIVSIICSSLMLAGCGAKTQSLKDFYEDEGIEEISKIKIVDGSTGYAKTITDEETINEFLSLINDIQFIPQENQEARYGWRYSITLYAKEGHFSFTLAHIGDYYYDSEPDIHPIVDEFYQNLKVEEN